MPREFVVDGRVFPDPDSTQSVEEVKRLFSGFFPEVATAETIETKKEDGTQVVEFRSRVGTKG